MSRELRVINMSTNGAKPIFSNIFEIVGVGGNTFGIRLDLKILRDNEYIKETKTTDGKKMYVVNEEKSKLYLIGLPVEEVQSK